MIHALKVYAWVHAYLKTWRQTSSRKRSLEGLITWLMNYNMHFLIFRKYLSDCFYLHLLWREMLGAALLIATGALWWLTGLCSVAHFRLLVEKSENSSCGHTGTDFCSSHLTIFSFRHLTVLGCDDGWSLKLEKESVGLSGKPPRSHHYCRTPWRGGSSQMQLLWWRGPHLHNYTGRGGTWESENDETMSSNKAGEAPGVLLTLESDWQMAHTEFITDINPVTTTARGTLFQIDTSLYGYHIWRDAMLTRIWCNWMVLGWMLGWDLFFLGFIVSPFLASGKIAHKRRSCCS